MGEIALQSVSKIYERDVRAVDDVTLDVGDGEFMVLVGPSGCGKSTLLRMIAGLEEITEGRIAIANRDVTAVEPRSRDIAMVFQNYALYPHMTVRENLSYGLKVRKTPKREIAERVDRAAVMLGLDLLMDRKPSALSGGQRQRVAMGRAVVREPAAFLMDEPLSNLDAKLRVGMRASLAQLHARLRTTTVYVTHDQTEAMTLGERVAVMRNGRVQQVDEPQRLYRRPVNLFVAAFIGSPAMNLVEAELGEDEVLFAENRIPLDRAHRPRVPPGGRIILGIRPEDFEDADYSDRGLPQFEVEVSVVEELGSESQVVFAVNAPRIDVDALHGALGDEDAGILQTEASYFTGRVDARSAAAVGDRLRLTLDPSRFYFFDPATGENLTLVR
jgi:multiple sugar transport system ATP-binding protein